MINPDVDIAIIGGGFSGTMVAVHLLKREPSLSVAVVDPSSALGRGVAYESELKCHLLNVGAGNMSAFPGDAGHFLRWAQASYKPWVQPRTFLPRNVYGQYVASLLASARKEAPTSRFRWIKDEVVSLRCDGVRHYLKFGSSAEVSAHAVVLALGNLPPADPKIPGITPATRRYIAFARSSRALTGLASKGRALIVGSGLTALDVAIGLKSRGFFGHIHILSRHGLIPQQQQATDEWPQFWDADAPPTVRGLLRLVRRQVRIAAAVGVDWRAVIDALRPVVPQIWRALPIPERKRFLRHVRPYWEVHRHRVAPEISDIISDLICDGMVEIHAGRITRYCEDEHAAVVTYHTRGSGVDHTLRVDRVFNCTGSESDCRRIDSPLLTSLFAQGIARPDALALGLDVAENGAVIGEKGIRSSSLFAIGPLRKGCDWETTAVPEIRKQAENLGAYLAQHFAPRAASIKVSA